MQPREQTVCVNSSNDFAAIAIALKQRRRERKADCRREMHPVSRISGYATVLSTAVNELLVAVTGGLLY